MHLSKSESKAVLVNLFRLSLALSEKRNDDAISAYSRILDYTLYDADDELPSLIPIVQPKQDEIDLIISEIKQEPTETAVPTLYPTAISAGSGVPTTSAPITYNNMASAFASVLNNRKDFEHELSHINHTGSDDEVEESFVSGEEDEEEEEEEEGEEEEEEEEEELPLESVRIKKVFYWKNTDNGDIYKCLPDGELGEKVGRYVDDKPVFD